MMLCTRRFLVRVLEKINATIDWLIWYVGDDKYRGRYAKES